MNFRLFIAAIKKVEGTYTYILFKKLRITYFC